LSNKFFEPDPSTLALLEILEFDVNEFLPKFADSEFLVGLVVSGEEKLLVKHENENYLALAIFTTLEKLNAFEVLARPTVMTGSEIAELALTSGSGLIEIDPPDEHRIITGSMSSALLDGTHWIDPADNTELNQLIENFLSSYREIQFALQGGDWTDLKIYLSGDFDLIGEIAPQMASFLSQSEIALKYLPSGADILYSHG
jgi:hypothetical protein